MKLTILVILSSLMILTGCSLPLKSDLPKTHTYRLSPSIQHQAAIDPRLNVHLYLPTIEVTPGLDSSHIVILKTAYEQDVIAHSQWPDELSTYLTAVITDTLSASNYFATVNNKQITHSNNYKLLLKVSAFQVELPQPNAVKANVVINMEALLIHSKTKKLRMHQRYTVKGKQLEVRVSSLVEGLNNALSRVLILLTNDLRVALK